MIFVYQTKTKQHYLEVKERFTLQRMEYLLCKSLTYDLLTEEALNIFKQNIIIAAKHQCI